MRLAALLPVVLSVAVTTRLALAQEEAPAASKAPAPAPAPAPAEEKESPVKVHGYLLGALSGRTTGERPAGGEGGDFVLGEGRLRLEASGAGESGDPSFLFKGDLF